MAINDISDPFQQKLFVPRYPSTSMTLDSKLEMNPSLVDTQGISWELWEHKAEAQWIPALPAQQNLHQILHKHSTTANPEPLSFQERIRKIKPLNYLLWWL